MLRQMLAFLLEGARGTWSVIGQGGGGASRVLTLHACCPADHQSFHWKAVAVLLQRRPLQFPLPRSVCVQEPQTPKKWRRRWWIFYRAFAFYFKDDKLSVCGPRL